MKPIFRMLSYLLCMGILVAGIAYADMKIRSLWKDVAFRQAILQDVPTQTSQTVALKKELDGALDKMQSINKTVPTEDEIVEVIAAISAEAIASGVSAQVPVVAANTKTETSESADLFLDVRIHVVASGDVAALASFLYRVEHLPYILRVAFWKIDTMQQTAIASYSENGPSVSPEVKPVLGTSLEADIAIVTKK